MPDANWWAEVAADRDRDLPVTCPNCGHVGKPRRSANPPVRPGDPPSYDVLCAECAFVLETHTEPSA